MSSSRNTTRVVVPPAPPTRPLSPRSVIASLLLGMHPPRIRGALLVRWCRHLGIPEGTTRVALSRMVDAGELTRATVPSRERRTGARPEPANGRYELAGPLRARQAGQDWALAPMLLPWSGDWVLWIVTPGRRDAGARAALRRAAHGARLVELRDGVWARPHNLPPEATAAGAAEVLAAQARHWISTPAPGEEPDVAQLFDLPSARARSLLLLDALGGLTTGLEAGELELLGPSFASGAAALQQIRRDPLLPPELAGDDWPGDTIRAAYARFQAAFASAVTEWFAAAET
jgi:phenylacetic acid degradation operon negative regulatory protein